MPMPPGERSMSAEVAGEGMGDAVDAEVEVGDLEVVGDVQLVEDAARRCRRGWRAPGSESPV